MSTFIETNNNFRWALHFNPIYAAYGDWTALTNSCLEYVVFTGTPTAISVANSGTILASGYTSNDASALQLDFNSAITLGASIDRTPDVFMVTGAPFLAAQDLHGGISWREIL